MRLREDDVLDAVDRKLMALTTGWALIVCLTLVCWPGEESPILRAVALVLTPFAAIPWWWIWQSIRQERETS